MGKQMMPEENPEFRSAEEWAAEYRPVKRGSGIRDCAGGTLFDPFGEDRQYVGRMGEVFAWAVLNNGYFDYIQNGFATDAIGYLVSDNPVRFADVDTKFVIGYEEIDWEAFARLQESGRSPAPESDPEEFIEDSLDELDVEDVEDEDQPDPDEDDSGVPTASDDFAEPSSIECSPVVEDATDETVAPAEGVSNEITEEARYTPEESPSGIDPVEDVSEEPELPEIIDLPAALAPEREAPLEDPPAYVEARSDAAEGAEVNEPQPDVYSDETPAAEAQQIYANPTEGGPAGAADIPTASGLGLEYPSEDQQTSPSEDFEADWPEEPPAQELVAMRRLPIGSEAAQLDREAYGPWPDVVMCKACRGTGCFAGIEMCGIGCEECDERGWNPAPGTPHEIPIYA